MHLVKLLNLEQNTETWKSWRRSKIGASDCAAIMGKNQYQTPYDLWRQKTFAEENFYNEDMRRGHDLEEEAREWLKERFGRSWVPICAESDTRPWQVASLDGFSTGDDGILCAEIKAPRLKKIKEIKKNGIPEYWLWQMQHQMSVMDCKEIYFLAYSKEIQHFEKVPRNTHMIEALNRHEEEFYYTYMCGFTPPPFLEREANFIRLYA